MAKTAQSPYPEWVLKFRKPGTEIRRKDGKFYVYKVSSVYDKEKKRARKITGAYLGKITEAEGFVRSDKVKVSKTLPIVNSKKLTTREYGMSTFIERYCNDIIGRVKRWRTGSVFRTVFPAPASSNVACRFPALRSLNNFAPRVFGLSFGVGFPASYLKIAKYVIDCK